jgi:hypothetical protein
LQRRFCELKLVTKTPCGVDRRFSCNLFGTRNRSAFLLAGPDQMLGTQAKNVPKERLFRRSAATVTVELAADANGLIRHLGAWETLCKDPLERNVFLEPWQFLSAVDAFGDGKESLFLFVYRKPPTTLSDREVFV